MALKDVLIAIEQIGLTDVILPFILVFTVVFAVLQRSKVLGADEKGSPKANYNAMVALVIAFFVLILARTLQVITWFTRYLALLLVMFVFFAIIFSLLGVREDRKNAIMFIALMLIAIVFLQVLAWTGVIDPELVTRFLLPILVIAFLVGGAWMMLHRHEKPASAKKQPEGGKPGKGVQQIEIPVGQLGPEERRV